MGDKVMIAGVQMDPEIHEKRKNTAKVIDLCHEARKKGARIVVFPECALTGYCFSDFDEVLSVAEPVPGPSTRQLEKTCRELDIFLLMGLVEKHDGACYNAAVLIGPQGVVGIYRKIHLPFLGLDRFVSPGNIPFTVHNTPWGKLGWLICYDGSFPESARVLALKGAEIVALLTNWPDDSESSATYLVPARAIENRVNFVAVNRVGQERGFTFIGRSRIVDYEGNTLAKAGPDTEEVICATVNLEGARNKHVVVVPGEYEMHRMRDRRPEFYGPITKPADKL
jgi:predicted amidohydrolase